MDVRVFLHVGFLVESLAAVLARIGSGVAVDEEVRGQRGRSLEAFAALLALKTLLLCVYGPMLRQRHGVAERLVANFAGERPLAAV